MELVAGDGLSLQGPTSAALGAVVDVFLGDERRTLPTLAWRKRKRWGGSARGNLPS
jgi:hypothetical protein